MFNKLSNMRGSLTDITELEKQIIDYKNDIINESFLIIKTKDMEESNLPKEYKTNLIISIFLSFLFSFIFIFINYIRKNLYKRID